MVAQINAGIFTIEPTFVARVTNFGEFDYLNTKFAITRLV